MKLSIGKVPTQVLREVVLPAAGVTSRDLVVKPTVGVDFAVIRFARGFLVSSSDPITGTSTNVGWHAVHVSANDVATSGCRPRFLEAVILLPEAASTDILRRITSQMNRACRQLMITIVGGHTESTPELTRPIVVTTAFGFTQRFVTASGVHPGDLVLMTKTAGLEGTAILAREYSSALGSVSSKVLSRAGHFLSSISIVDEATACFRTGQVTAMHDPTEGGVLGGLYEMSVASRVGFVVEEGRIPIASETLQICAAMNIDPLRLIASGSLLLAVRPKGAESVLQELKRLHIKATVIGKFQGKERVLIQSSGTRQTITETVDEIWRLPRQYRDS